MRPATKSDESDNYDFWTAPRGLERSIDIMVPPAFASRFVAALNAFNTTTASRSLTSKSKIFE